MTLVNYLRIFWCVETIADSEHETDIPHPHPTSNKAIQSVQKCYGSDR